MTDRLTDERLDELAQRTREQSFGDGDIIYASREHELRLIDQAKEANRLERELARAMAVVNVALELRDAQGTSISAEFWTKERELLRVLRVNGFKRTE